MKVESEFVFVGRGDEGFLENYAHELEEDPGLRGGKLFMSLEILNNDAEAEEIAEAAFQALKQVFYADLEKPAYDRFEEAVKKVNAVLEEFRASKVSRFIGNLNILVAALAGRELFLTQTGDAEAYLIRKRYVSVVSEGANAPREEGDFFVDIASGDLEESDVVLLSSSRLLRYMTKNDLARFLTIPGKAQSLTEGLSLLQDHLMTEILGRSALIAVRAGEDEAGEDWEGVGEAEGAAAAPAEEARAVSLPGWAQKFAVHKHFSKFLTWGGQKTNRLKEFIRSNKFGKDKSKFSIKDFAQDRILVALVVVIILLLVGIVYLRISGTRSGLVVEYQANLARAEELIADAATQGQFDREKGAALLTQAENLALEVLNSRYLRNNASRVLDDVQKQRGLLDNVVVVSQPKVVADLTEKRSSVSALGLLFLKDRLYAFDTNTLFEVLLDQLMEPKTISDTESVVLGAPFPDQDALVFMTRNGKVIEYRDGRFFFMDTADTTWKKGVAIATYSDRLYVLDPERNQIWRYRRRRDNYDIGEPQNQDADLGKAKSLAIDGSVYVLSEDGSITMLYAGKKQDIPFHDSPFSSLKNPTQIFTDADLGQLFVLEPSTDRVVVFLKDRRQGGSFPTQLIYQNQYLFQGVGELRGLYVSKDEGKLYVADESKVYVTDLTQ